MFRHACLAITFALTCVVHTSVAQEQPSPTLVSAGVLAADAKLELVADGYKFTEGPASDANGNVYFTDQPNDQILRFDVESRQVTTWMKPAGRSNGLFFDPQGNLVACADEFNELWSIRVDDKSHRKLVTDWQGKKLNGPNDCWVDRDGSIYFTDPYYKRPYWNREQPPLDRQNVYRLAADGKQLVVAATDFAQPNGIVGDRDKRTLFVADIRGQKTYRFRIVDSGELVDRELHCEAGSDGMTLDRDGRLYLTGKEGVTVFSPEGGKLGTIPVPQGWTANVCFGGESRGELFITAGSGFYSIPTLVNGL